jgi:ABC-2 type transport system ATP-binding protein
MLWRVSEPVIAARGLRKSYGDLDAVKGIDLEVHRGEIFALLGPNGAGKTTTIEILEGFRAPSAGEVRVLGTDPLTGGRAFKERVGIVLQSVSVERFLTVEEVLELHRGYYPAPRPLDELLELVGLSEQRKARVGWLSGGQQRRLDVALGLAGDPEVLFLDEPTTGFDPAARRGAWDMVKGLRALGKTVMLTTHYMDEAQELADRVAIISAGRIVAQGPPASLAGRDRGATRITLRDPGEPLPEGLQHERVGQALEIVTASPTRTLHALTSWALERGIELDLEVKRPSLEDVYLELTGEA